MNRLSARLLLFAGDLTALAVTWLAVDPLLCRLLDISYASLKVDSSFNLLVAILSALSLFLLHNKRHYMVRIPWWSQVRDIAVVMLLALLIHGFTQFGVPRYFIILYWSMAFLLLLLGRHAARSLSLALGIWKVNTVIIGDGENAVDTFYAIHSDHFPGYDVTKLILRCKDFESFDVTRLPAEFQSVPIVDGRNGIAKGLDIRPDEFYIIALDTFRGELRELLLKRMMDAQANYVIVPPIRGTSLYGMEPHYFFGSDTMFLRPRNKIEYPGARFVKRGMDVLGALFGLALSSPVFLLVYLTARRNGYNTFFGHIRIGKNAKPFTCCKFQTMVPDAKERLKEILENDPEARKEWNKTHKLKNDPRVHPIGKFLRKTSLDELPQLWNVLKGEMSLVGPRPIVKAEMKYYEDHLDYYLSVRPGITGLWQASGRSDTSYAHRVYLDGWYVRNWSLSQDLVIIFKTIYSLLFRGGAY